MPIRKLMKRPCRPSLSPPMKATVMNKTLPLAILLLALSACASPETPHVVKTAPQPEPTYSIIAGDVLQISVWKEDNLDREVLVLPDGSISFPLVGSIMAQGHTPPELQDTIKTKLARLIPNAVVSVSVKAALGHTVSVIGQVTKPGELVISHRLTALQALSQAGGLTPFASEGKIIVLRTKNDEETSIPVPYDDIIYGDELDKDLVLVPGDVVVVPTAKLF
jgi:polysaccharide export outer membrane protein